MLDRFEGGSGTVQSGLSHAGPAGPFLCPAAPAASPKEYRATHGLGVG
jgi:hypothetical protein